MHSKPFLTFLLWTEKQLLSCMPTHSMLCICLVVSGIQQFVKVCLVTVKIRYLEFRTFVFTITPEQISSIVLECYVMLCLPEKNVNLWVYLMQSNISP